MVKPPHCTREIQTTQTEPITLNTIVLNAPRPGTTTGGIDLFINSANRTDDGGASTATLRNGSGDFRLGNASYDTIIDGSEVVIPQGKSIKLTGNYSHAAAKLYIDRDGVQSWGSTTAYDAFRFFETRNSSGAEHFNAVKIGAAGIAIGYDPPTYSNGGTVGFTCSKKVGIGTGSPAVQLQIQGTSPRTLGTSNGPSYSDYGQLVITDSTAPSGTATLGNLKMGFDASTGTFGTGFIQCVNPNVYTPSFVLQPYGGNVGISDTSPSYKLDVSGDIRMVGKCIVQTYNDPHILLYLCGHTAK
jgi:hypothetical protein